MEDAPAGAWRLRLLGGVAVVVAIAAVGALADLGPFADEELSRGELIAAGDQICSDAHKAFAELQADPPQTPREAEELTGKLADIAADENDRLAELNGPEALGGQLEEYLSAREDGISALRDGVAAAADGDATAYAEAQEALAESQRERTELAKSLGFGECSRPIDAAEGGSAEGGGRGSKSAASE